MSVNQWKPELYDSHLQFVSQYGQSVLELLHPKSEDIILDLGCGTGDLSKEISEQCKEVIGLDLSNEMIKQAREKYPEIQFIQASGSAIPYKGYFDAVFSNAALHWMKNAEEVIQSVSEALKPKGRFVAELGGSGNVKEIIHAIDKVLVREFQINGWERSPWYFPTVGEYTSLLETYDFEVQFVQFFDCPTFLGKDETGLIHWLEAFSGDFFPEFSENERTILYKAIVQEAQASLENKKTKEWFADYRRLRLVAKKL